MIVSNDSIMKPPYEISPRILQLISSISEKIGEVNANYLTRQSPLLRKQNRIKTIHSSLKIEGNTLSEDQITALIESKKVLGPKKDICEVLNAIKLYDMLDTFDPLSEKSFLKAHQILMNTLILSAGKYRNKSVGIVKGSDIAHVAPSSSNVPFLMKDLFKFLKTSKELPLIKSCIFHYEMEFIHPFMDGNGRMGRLWQTLILMKTCPVFEFLPFESLISKTQDQYYQALSLSDKSEKSTLFIEYMLDVLNNSLGDLMNYRGRVFTDLDRIEHFLTSGIKEFSRKDYMNYFKHISSATASRDLLKGVKLKYFKKSGSQNQTMYRIVL